MNQQDEEDIDFKLLQFGVGDSSDFINEEDEEEYFFDADCLAPPEMNTSNIAALYETGRRIEEVENAVNAPEYAELDDAHRDMLHWILRALQQESYLTKQDRKGRYSKLCPSKDFRNTFTILRDLTIAQKVSAHDAITFTRDLRVALTTATRRASIQICEDAYVVAKVFTTSQTLDAYP